MKFAPTAPTPWDRTVHLDRRAADEAERLHVTNFEYRRRVLGEEHPRTLATMNNLAALYNDQGKYAKSAGPCMCCS